MLRAAPSSATLNVAAGQRHNAPKRELQSEIKEMSAPTQEFYDRAGVVAYAQARGITRITENSVNAAAYHDDRPLKRTKIHGRIYHAHSDVEAWLAGERLDD
jgi:hypothetical protein